MVLAAKNNCQRVLAASLRVVSAMTGNPPLVSKINNSNPTDGAQMSHFIMNLNQHRKTLLLQGFFPLPLDISTMTVITRFIAAALGKIYKIRAKWLRELEGPWLSLNNTFYVLFSLFNLVHIKILLLSYRLLKIL